MPASTDDFALTPPEIEPEPESQAAIPFSVKDVAAQGGRARAEALPAETRSEIARRAAATRWHSATPYATHEGVLPIGSLELPVAVLEGGIRVISSQAMLTALGRPWKGTYRRTKRPSFLDANNLIPFITQELLDVLNGVEYVNLTGRKVFGYKAELLPLVCEVYLAARAANALTARQAPTARQAEILVRSLSKVGIVALVDEATGYQEVRDREALQAILDKYLRKEFAAWAKRFPDEFYQHIFRMRDWKWRGMYVNGPRVLANYTKDIVYKRLAPGILEQLETINPKDERGVRRAKHHQFFTEDIGHPALAQHIHAVIGLMRISNSWFEFQQHLNRAFPRRGNVLALPLDR